MLVRFRIPIVALTEEAEGDQVTSKFPKAYPGATLSLALSRKTLPTPRIQRWDSKRCALFQNAQFHWRFASH